MFHSKSSSPRQRLPVPPLLILVAMLICIFIPSPLSIPKPPAPVFRPPQMDHGTFQQQQQHIVQQQPDSQNQPDFHTNLDAKLDTIERQPDSQQPHNTQTQSRDQSQLDAQPPSSAQDQHDALEETDAQLRAADAQQLSGVQYETNNQKQLGDDQQPNTAQRPISEQLEQTLSNSNSNKTMASDTDTPPDDFKPCSHIVLFSAPRHGSTWFIDSVEGCSFTRANNGTFGGLNSKTELWNGGQDGIVRNMSIGDAIQYVVNNMSLKLFPSPLKFRRDDASAVIDGARLHNVPFVMLTRKPESALKSLLVAKETHVWNRVANTSSASIDLSVEDEELTEYRNVITKHFNSARNLLESKGISYDSVDYDVVKNDPWIKLPKSLCYVRNCNFEPSATEIATNAA